MNCDTRDLIIPHPDPSPLETELARVKALLESRTRELRCWRESLPGYLYSENCDLLIVVGDMDFIPSDG
jgi:hypothetical protein